MIILYLSFCSPLPILLRSHPFRLRKQSSVSRYSCCKAPVSANNGGCSPRYACCLLPVNTAGCKKVCKKCGSEWGSPANGCFRKDHTLAEISETKREELTEENKKEGIIGGNSEEQDEKIKDQGEVEDGRTNQFKHLPPIITYHMF